MIRTRFAPSPTGYLHIGGVRTALFCWLFARRHGGRFILRIDDTDQQRNVEEALQPILDGLRWLGIDWDEGPDVGGPHAPYYQSQRSERHQAAVEELLSRGSAYHDYATSEEVQAERLAAQRQKQPAPYSRRFMAETPEQQARFEAQGRKPVVRLKIPREGTLVIDDLVRGRVEFEWAREQDQVIRRADGSCLYHLASVVDDHDLGITHVIRAEEHLSNTPRQIFIAQSLGYELPSYAHLPYVTAPLSKAKLSKRKLAEYCKNRDFAKLLRHGEEIAQAIGRQTTPELFNPVIVDFYRQVGYLPEAIINYLALLGWSLDDKTEHFSRQQLIESFSLDRVNRAPAGFDPQKLSAFQDHHMQEVPIERKLTLVLPYLQQAGLVASTLPGDLEPKLIQILKACGDRIKVAGDILAYADFFFLPLDRLTYDEKAFQKRLRKPGAAELLGQFKDQLATTEPFNTQTLEKAMHDFVDSQQIKVGQIIHAVRLAVTGKAFGPGLFDCLAILGKNACLERIERALQRV